MAVENGRVTNRDLYNVITDLRKEMKEDIKDVRDDVGDISQRVTAVETKTDNLSKRVSFWDAGNSAGVIVAGILAYFGIKS